MDSWGPVFCYGRDPTPLESGDLLRVSALSAHNNVTRNDDDVVFLQKVAKHPLFRYTQHHKVCR